VENDLVPGAFTPERLLALELLAAQAAISLENALLLERERAGRVEAEASSRRALLLAEATSLMSATFDYEGVFAALARLCARSFADWAVIDVIEDDHVVRLAGAHRDPTKEPLLRELRERYPVRFGSAMPAASALTAGQPTHLASISDEQVRSRTVDERHAELIEQLGSRSAIIIPLIARETRLGALSLVASSPFRFDPADVDLAVELGRRIALAMDNARLLRDTQQALRLREEFLSLASHELRTPLTSLRLTVEALLDASTNDKPFASDVVGRCLRRIVRETERLDDLSAELLDVARIERGELSLHPTSLDLAALAHEVAMRLEPDLRAASCTVSVSGDAPVFGKWDRSRLAQLVTVLLSNAIKFGAGRPIDVRVRKRDGAAQLSVEDRGIGIEQARLARVFERFERGVPFTHYGGLGLGLYIARAIVLAHGGSIRADSTPGIGSTFSVELPCVATASEPTHVMH
jgi:signal transduction histidine kinase